MQRVQLQDHGDKDELKMKYLKEYYLTKNERLKSKSLSLIQKKVAETHKQTYAHKFKRIPN